MHIHDEIINVAFPIINLITSIRKVLDNKEKYTFRHALFAHLDSIYGTLTTNGQGDPRTETASFLKPKSKTNAEPTSNDAGNYHRYQQMENLDIILPWPVELKLLGGRAANRDMIARA